MIDLSQIEAARQRIRDEIVLTPCTASLGFGDLVPCEILFKFENLHRTGSFKERGALNKLLQLTDEERERGVVTASAGNHAQAVAFHASRLGIPTTVVMPETTPLIKVSKTREYGAEVVMKGTVFDDAVEVAHRLVEEHGKLMLPAFEDEAVIAGQGTIALELLEQAPDLDVVVVPIGGGGLISGIALGLKAHRPEIRVVGVEAEAAPSARASLFEGGVVEIESTETIADGIAVKRVGELTFPLIREYVDDIVTVTEEEIATAILMLLEREKTMAEGAGAVPLAALMRDRIEVEPEERAVLVLSGGNIDINMISRIIDRGLVADGRLARLRITVPDRPGSLAKLTGIVAELGANVLEIYHRRAFADISVGDVEIVMHLETRGREHVEEIIRHLESAGHRVQEEI